MLVDQRGTGASNPLRCALAGNSDYLQGYLEPIFQPELFRDCLARLEPRADLTQYTTPVAMDDLAELLDELGYGEVNLIGGSYGTRAALVFMRRHPERVRTAVLNGVAPIAFKNPLFHAREAQSALELLFDACAADPGCGAAFPALPEEFAAVMARLEETPGRVTAVHSGTEEDVELTLSREAFAEALRVMMYYTPTARQVPLAIHRASEGDYKPFVQLGLQANRSLRDQLAFGMLLCVTCSEDLPRISEEEIRRETAGTFLGDGRVRSQAEVCSFWPRGAVPADYGEPVRSEAPALILSGTFDPVTPPRFGEEAARHLPNSLHVVAPGSHGLGGACIDGLIAALLQSGSVEGLDTSCVESLRFPAFELPGPR